MGSSGSERFGLSLEEHSLEWQVPVSLRGSAIDAPGPRDRSSRGGPLLSNFSRSNGSVGRPPPALPPAGPPAFGRLRTGSVQKSPARADHVSQQAIGVPHLGCAQPVGAVQRNPRSPMAPEPQALSKAQTALQQLPKPLVQEQTAACETAETCSWQRAARPVPCC